MKPTRTIHIGLGPIGLQTLQAGLAASQLQPVAAADLSPDIHGRRLADLAPDAPDVEVLADTDAALQSGAAAGAQVVLLATGSKLPDIVPQICAAIHCGLNLISTSEELTFPWLRHPALADELDAAARHRGVTVVGTGINPGFLLDLLPLLLCRPCRTVRSVTARRIVNVSLRRPQLQRKIGSGLAPDAYHQLAASGDIGHVGLGESAALLAAGLGWKHDGVEEAIVPVIAQEETGTEHFAIQPGEVMGSHQTARIVAANGGVIELICRMTHGEPDPHDEVIVDGDPSVRMRIEGGIFGDTATAGCTVNILRQVVDARPGLLTVKDLPVG